MFALFYSLFQSMFLGSWTLSNISQINTNIGRPLKGTGILLTSIFNNVSTPFEDMTTYFGTNDIINLTSFILALITSIGIVVMAVKGIKRIFSVFFYGVR